MIVWRGLRGTVPVALALYLPADLVTRDGLTAIDFGGMLVPPLVQGSSMRVLLLRLGLVQRHGNRNDVTGWEGARDLDCQAKARELVHHCQNAPVCTIVTLVFEEVVCPDVMRVAQRLIRRLLEA